MLDVTVSAGTLARGGDVHGEVRIEPGGSAANVAAWAAHAGAAVTLRGCVGEDAAGGIVREALRRHGVEDRLAVAAGARTGAMLVVTEAGERSMVAHRGANSRLTIDGFPGTLDAAAVFVSGYTILDPATDDLARSALARARAPHVAVDAASWPLIARRGPEWFFDATRRANVLFANEREARVLTDAGEEDAARQLADRYEIAFVKLGARGALLATGRELLVEPATPIIEVDATGAGDAFDGAFLAALAQGASLREALARACVAGARCAAQAERWPVEV
jgi:sugar/nucleoside kinase (ribokinase family)